MKHEKISSRTMSDFFYCFLKHRLYHSLRVLVIFIFEERRKNYSQIFSLQFIVGCLVLCAFAWIFVLFWFWMHKRRQAHSTSDVVTRSHKYIVDINWDLKKKWRKRAKTSETLWKFEWKSHDFQADKGTYDMHTNEYVSNGNRWVI